MSSEHRAGPAENCFDGVVVGALCHSNRSSGLSEEWVRVDLQDSYPITGVQLANRRDTYGKMHSKTCINQSIIYKYRIQDQELQDICILNY